MCSRDSDDQKITSQICGIYHTLDKIMHSNIQVLIQFDGLNKIGFAQPAKILSQPAKITSCHIMISYYLNVGKLS